MPPAITIMANTMEAAPLSPDQEIRMHCRREGLKGSIKRNTAMGLAAKVRKRAMARDGRKISGSRWGKDKSPSKKKINIWASPVIPSKKCTSVILLLMGLFPE